jgi:hypothetical protein
MNFSKYTTQELEFITSNVELLKKELEERYIKESDNFPFKSGDVIYTKSNDGNFLLKIKEIDKRYNKVVADEIAVVDEIEIRDDGTFDVYVDEWYDIEYTEWNEYVKIEDSEIFEHLIYLIDQHNDFIQRVNDDTYLKLKNEIAPYDN